MSFGWCSCLNRFAASQATKKPQPKHQIALCSQQHRYWRETQRTSCCFYRLRLDRYGTGGVVLDTHGSVISLAAIQAPPGTQVPPARTAYNPWSANLAYWGFSGDMTGQYPLVISAVAGQPAGVDVTGQAASFGFVGNSGEYSHQTCVK